MDFKKLTVIDKDDLDIPEAVSGLIAVQGKQNDFNAGIAKCWLDMQVEMLRGKEECEQLDRTDASLLHYMQQQQTTIRELETRLYSLEKQVREIGALL